MPDPAALGRYQVVRRLGKGGMGSVYLARDPRLDRLVAIKLLQDDLLDDPAVRERFEREARAAAGLRHPNIVTIHDVGEVDGQPFIAMEYIPGESLAAIVRRRTPLPLSRRLSFIEGVCHGLAHAHKAGIVHRDIKPANIMVDHDGTPMVVDFGIARVAESTITRGGELVGTLNYMSPEQLNGRAVDHRSDIFAVGAVLYELVSYRRAFPGSITDGLLDRLLHRPPEPLVQWLPGLDPEIDRIVGRALHKDRSARYADLTEMARDVERVRERVATMNDADTMGADNRLLPGGPPPVTPSPTPLSPRRAGDAERLLRRRQDEIAQHLLAAEAEFGRGSYEAAIEHAERAATLDPHEARALDLIERARCALDAGEAQRCLAEAARHVAQKELTRATALADQAARLIPPDSAADLHEDLQRVRRAIDETRNEIAEAPRRRPEAEAAPRVQDEGRRQRPKAAFLETATAAPTRRRILPWLAAAVALVAAVVTTTLIWRPWEPQPSTTTDTLERTTAAPDTSAAVGSVVIQSTPPGARARLDGRDVVAGRQSEVRAAPERAPSPVLPLTPSAASVPTESGPPGARARLDVPEAGATPVSPSERPPAPRTLERTTSLALDERTTLTFVRIAARSFEMGSTNGGWDERPVHRVTLTQGFELGTHEVTQAQWAAVMGNNPSYFTDCGGPCPVEQVSWEDVHTFLAKLNARQDGYTYRLPTEAEWEYSARAGTTGDYAGNLGELGWYDQNAGGMPHPVGQKRPNAWGLYDMHGSVWEWVSDWQAAYPSSAVTDPTGPSSGAYRVYRGGSWSTAAGSCRSASRGGGSPGVRGGGLGFRLLRVQSPG